MNSIFTSFFLLLLLHIVYASTDNKVLLISMDGFRWDYIDMYPTPNFDKLLAQGVRVKKVKNVFATNTFPNHWTMVTGLYEEDHGIVGNKMYDPVYQEKFSFGRDTKWFNDTEPIWITAVREGKKSAAYMFLGNEAVYDDLTATRFHPFSSNADPQFGMDVVIDWLATDDLDLACFYMDEPDKTGHSYGPESPEMAAKVAEIDLLLGHLFERIQKRQLQDKLNVIIASDHGMTEVAANRTINLAQWVDFRNDVEFSYISSSGHILPKENKTQLIYEALRNASMQPESHFSVYYKADVPEEFHYSNHRRIQPIVLIAENGWIMKSSNYKFNLNGNHGFNNSWDDMKSMMVAIGPDFKNNYMQEDMDIIDLYPMMCELLGLTTCHSSPGKPLNYMELLDPGSGASMTSPLHISIITLLAFIRAAF